MTCFDDVSPRLERPVDIKLGNIQVRLAETAAEIEAAQRLRYRVFFEEMKATPNADVAAQKLDFDRFDSVCDHLLVLSDGVVVGTYRLIRRSVANKIGGHYSAAEFNIKPVLEYHGEICEVGRSCVDSHFRTRGVMQLLWQGIAAYVFYYDLTMLFGCASMEGTDPSKLALPLSYLHYHHLAPPAICVRALPERYIDMRRMEPSAINPRDGFNSLPPLIKGYLRLGGYVGEGAVIDPEFNTTDVFIIVTRETLSDRYLRHYERKNGEAE